MTLGWFLIGTGLWLLLCLLGWLRASVLIDRRRRVLLRQGFWRYRVPAHPHPPRDQGLRIILVYADVGQALEEMIDSWPRRGP